MTESSAAAIAGRDTFDDFEFHLHYRHDDELRDALAGLDLERRRAAVPARDHQVE